MERCFNLENLKDYKKVSGVFSVAIVNIWQLFGFFVVKKLHYYIIYCMTFGYKIIVQLDRRFEKWRVKKTL